MLMCVSRCSLLADRVGPFPAALRQDWVCFYTFAPTLHFLTLIIEKKTKCQIVVSRVSFSLVRCQLISIVKVPILGGVVSVRLTRLVHERPFSDIRCLCHIQADLEQAGCLILTYVT